jgi:hypothetical protein
MAAEDRTMTEWIEAHRTVSFTAALALAVVSAGCLIRGVGLFARGLRNPDHPEQSTWVVRGVRLAIVAIGLLFIAGGFYWAKGWPFLFGAVFLGEELFETGIMLAALHDERRERVRAARSARQ